eukprot:6213016-Pleurochrysis_carterae.AAC.3
MVAFVKRTGYLLFMTVGVTVFCVASPPVARGLPFCLRSTCLPVALTMAGPLCDTLSLGVADCTGKAPVKSPFVPSPVSSFSSLGLGGASLPMR